MLPVFAIVGRPNVGKSTLFNRLTKTRKAIVSEIAGVTRDRHYGHGACNDRSFIVVDTGGIEDFTKSSETDIEAMTLTQALIAMREATVILFVVDALTGLTGADLDIMQQLRRMKLTAPIALVINKSDRESAEVAASDFYSLGVKQLFSISANTGRGVDAMVAALLPAQPKDESLENTENTDETTIISASSRTRIAVLGRPNVGKSTLINRLFGEDRVIVLDMPGTTRDTIEIPYDRHDKHYLLVDTAGIRRRGKIDEAIESYSVVKAMQAMKSADVVIMVMDAREGITEQDMRLLGLIIESGNALVLAFNKWDHMSPEDREHFKEAVDRKLPFASFARRYYISAKHGTGVGKLYDAIDETQVALTQSFSTNKLTQIMMAAAEAHQPPLAQGRRVRLRFAHVGARRPLMFVIHGKQVEKLHPSYQQYLVNYFRDALQLTGIPLIVKCVNDDNPYAKAAG